MTVAIPFLPSLLPRQAWAQTCPTPPARFIMMASQWSSTPAQFSGNLTATTVHSEFARYRSLAGLSNISPIFGPEFNGLLNKISLLRGVDFYSGQTSVGHDYNSGACATPYGWYPDGYDPTQYVNDTLKLRGKKIDHDLPPIINISSIDEVLNAASSFNPKGLKNYSICPAENYQPPDYAGLSLYDWGNASNGSVRKGLSVATQDGVILRNSTQELYNMFVNQLTGGTVSTAPSTSSSDQDVLQGIYADYKSARDHSQISANDKLNLENFMSMISDLMKRLSGSTGSETTLTCNKPTLDMSIDTTTYGRFKNRVDIMVAAMACDLVRVASIQNSSLEDPGGIDPAILHSYHHSLNGNADSIGTGGQAYADLFYRQWVNAGKRTAYLLNRLNSFTEGGSTMLDNSLVYWYQQLGLAQNCGSSHASTDYGVMLAGGGRGAFKMGYFMDFRHQTEKFSYDYMTPGTPGVPFNNLLTSFCNAFGVPASAYERPNEPGFGAYRNEAQGIWLHALNKMSPTHRNKILAMRRENMPFIFNKAVCG